MIQQPNITPIEQTMLKGVSVKLMVTIIGATIAICTTFLGTYYKFQSALADTVKTQEGQGKLIEATQNTMHSLDLRLQQMQLQINTQEVRLNEIEKRYNSER